jgi:uncharacterized membrane protein YbhN (UPF0104 family)
MTSGRILRFSLVAVKLAISVALLCLALRESNALAVASSLSIENGAWIFFAIAAVFLQSLVSALRWRAVSAECGASLTVGQAFQFTMIGLFFSQLMPSSMGGDAMRIWFVGRQTNWRAATYSVIVDRVAGSIALAILVVGTLPWSYILIDSAEGRLALVVLALAAFGAGAVFLMLGLATWPWLNRWWLVRHLHGCSAAGLRAMFSSKHGVTIAALSLLTHVLTVVVAWTLAQAMSVPVLFEELFQLIPPVVLIIMLPISIAGWGIREAVMGLAFSYAGLKTAEGVTISLLFGGVYLVCSLSGGLIWMHSQFRTVLRSPEIVDGRAR